MEYPSLKQLRYSNSVKHHTVSCARCKFFSEKTPSPFSYSCYLYKGGTT